MRYFLLIFLFSYDAGYAQSLPDSSKKGDHLFHATPKKLMRDFGTDRPDVTESAYTVDAGHFQMETDLFKTERCNAEGVKTIHNYFNAANLKLGITRSLDMQIVVSTLQASKIKDGNTITKQLQFGGLTLRAKQNLWGNDKGKTALSVLPFINLPVRSSEKISGGIVFPFAMSMSNGWGFGAQLEADVADDEAGNNYHFNFLASATISHSLCKDIDFFVESFVTKETEIKKYEYFLNGGIIFSPATDINIDMGLYYGLKKESLKTYFIGISFRL